MSLRYARTGITELTEAASTIDAETVVYWTEFQSVSSFLSSEFVACVRDSGLTCQQVTSELAEPSASVGVLISI